MSPAETQALARKLAVLDVAAAVVVGALLIGFGLLPAALPVLAGLWGGQ